MVPKKMRAHCNECGGEKNHVILHEVNSHWSVDEGEIWGDIAHKMLQCAGCDSIKLVRLETCSEDYNEDGPVEQATYYPPAVFRPTPDWLNDLENEFRNKESQLPGLITEIYVALHNDQRMLAAMGVRAALESILIDTVGDQGSFTKNLKAFEAKGLVSGVQRERLETILDAGHATIHRMYRPRESDLIILIDITEHIIESVYLHEGKVSALKKRIPARK